MTTNKTSRDDVYLAISKERIYQERKWGVDRPQSLPGFILIMRKELEEVERAWNKNVRGDRQTCLEEIVQVAATAVACLERYGVEGITTSVNDTQ
jgi:hypothetical protein